MLVKRGAPFLRQGVEKQIPPNERSKTGKGKFMKHYGGYSGSVGDLAICKSAGFVIGLVAGGTLDFALALPFAAIGYMAGNLFYSVIYIIKTIFIFLFNGVSDASEALSQKRRDDNVADR